MWAVIKDGAVIVVCGGKPNTVELATRDEIAIEVDEAAPGMLYDGKRLSYPVKSRDEQRAEARDAVRQRHADFLRAVADGATDSERATWPVKSAAAAALVANTATPAQANMLSREANEAGGTVAALAADILAKEARYTDLVGWASGHRRKTEAAIAAANTPREVDDILRLSGKVWDRETASRDAKPQT